MKTRPEVVAFLEKELKEADKALKARIQMVEIWSTGTDAQWAEAGCKMDRTARQIEADRHARIRQRCFSRVEHLKSALALLRP